MPANLHEVESSNVARIGYDADTSEFHVEFKNGQTYIYEGVPEDVYDQVSRASSIGRAINHLCKNCFQFRKG